MKTSLNIHECNKNDKDNKKLTKLKFKINNNRGVFMSY